MEIVAFIKDNYVGFLLGLASAYPLMKFITKLTPWQWDDTLLENGRVIFKKLTSALGINTDQDPENTVDTGMDKPEQKQAASPDQPPKLPGV